MLNGNIENAKLDTTKVVVKERIQRDNPNRKSANTYTIYKKIFLIVIILSVIALGITLVVVFGNPKTNLDVTDNTTILTQSINDADLNISFDILLMTTI